jgi:hypothetical protein
VRTVESQVPPSASGHEHFPPSRFLTSRFTFGGTLARRFSCFSMRASSAAVSTCSSVAPGLRCDSPTLAFLRSARNPGVTVTWIRVSRDVSGSTKVRVGAG